MQTNGRRTPSFVSLLVLRQGDIDGFSENFTLTEY